jgi:hypothetical protein
MTAETKRRHHPIRYMRAITYAARLRVIDLAASGQPIQSCDAEACEQLARTVDAMGHHAI